MLYTNRTTLVVICNGERSTKTLSKEARTS